MVRVRTAQTATSIHIYRDEIRALALSVVVQFSAPSLDIFRLMYSDSDNVILFAPLLLLLLLMLSLLLLYTVASAIG